MKFIVKSLSLLAVGAAVVGCQDYDLGYSVEEIRYKENFAKVFGQIDPTQDWNLATRAAVTVTTDSPSDVQVYALTDGKYKLVADYANVSGTKELGFDVREDVTDLMVTNGRTAVNAKIGESVSFNATRAGHYGTTGDVTVTEITDEDQWFVFDRAESERYQEKLPEGGKDWDGDGNKDNNLGRVTQNFTFISNGEFTVYPIYWQTDDTDEVGIYFTDADGVYHEIPIFTIKSGDEMQYEYLKDGHNYNGSTEGLKEGELCPTHNCEILHMTNVSDNFAYIFCKSDACRYNGWNNVGGKSPSNGYFTAKSWIENSAWWGGNDVCKYYRSKGIKVNIPAGTLFGMYNYAPNFGKKQYSEQDRNGSTFNAPNKDVVAATFTLPSSEDPDVEDMYLCFEDWWASDGDADLNDVVFRFYGSTPTVVDKDPDVWVICAEDLGNTFDIDYNDVVVEVKHVSGKEEATVSAVAAGGILASYIYFGSECIGEVHELLGQPNGVSGQYSPVNVFGSVNTANIKDFTFPVSESWSLATSTVGDAAYTGDAGMGGFSVRVVPEGTQASETAAVGGQKIQNSTAAGSENVPYVFCVPRNYTRSYTEGENTVTIDAWFRWSNELKSLYPLAGYGAGTYSVTGHAFAEWVADKNNAKDWYKYPDLDNTTGIFYTMSMVDSEPPHIDPSNPGQTQPDPVNYGTKLSTISTLEDDMYTKGYWISPANLTADKEATVTVEVSSSASGDVEIWAVLENWTEVKVKVTKGNVGSVTVPASMINSAIASSKGLFIGDGDKNYEEEDAVFYIKQ